MSDEPKDPVDFLARRIDRHIDSYYAALRGFMRRQITPGVDYEWERGTVFVDDDGNEVGYLVPVATPFVPEE